MAAAGDLRALPARMADAGATEIEARSFLIGPPWLHTGSGERLWSGPDAAGRIDAFTGYSEPNAKVPLEICWHVSRPGESGAEAVPALQQRYPPLAGTTVTGTGSLSFGYTRWSAMVSGRELLVGVDWPLSGVPSAGTSILYVVRVVPPPEHAAADAPR